ncbi:MAG: glycosyltransferase [Selenomonadaceae bacterium]|nr:glycosyltransferase [Selenomonadaceae bacterium]
MNIFILHPSFPAQYLNLAPYLGRNPENKVTYLSKENSINAQLRNVTLALYKKPDEKAEKWIETCGPLRPAAEAVIEGQAAVRAMEWLAKEQGVKPDIIIAHTGWGSTLYCKDLYPNVPIIGYFEWFYHAENSDSFWWPDEIPQMSNKISIRTRNAHHLMNLDLCDAGITPTQWQYQQFPEEYKPKLHVIHEGIDTKFCSPDPSGKRPGLVLDDVKLNLPEGTEILTYVARGFEIYRGFPYFMDAVRILLQRRPNLHVVVVGKDRICYGAHLKDAQNKETTYLKEEQKKGGFDTNRVHFVGLRNRGDYQKILRASSCHVYLTRPFVLSWSCLEAMSFACPMVASKTPPVQEVIEDNVNGLLAEFRSPYHIARRVEELLDDRELAKKLGERARETIQERFELMKCMRAQEDLMYSLVR